MSSIDEVEVLKKISVVNRDDGMVFTDTGRLDVIAELLEPTEYRRLNEHGLFHLYGKKPLDEITGNVLLISTHVDTERSISRCFTKVKEDGKLIGTFDNMLTNAAALTAMLRGDFPENVLVAFTGDEEEDSVGAIQASRFLQNHSIPFFVIVLDVSDEGYGVADFTIENNCWNKWIAGRVISAAKSLGKRWRFVPEDDEEEIPLSIPPSLVILHSADDDESVAYNEKEIDCFSLCAPTRGFMHSDAGITTTVSAYKAYITALVTIVRACLGL